MSKDLEKLELIDLMDEIYKYKNKDGVFELKRRIREDVVETKNLVYYILVSQIYFVIAVTTRGDCGYDKLDTVLTYDKDFYKCIMNQMPIDHPSRVYFETIEDLIESEEKYDEYIFEIKTKLKLYKNESYLMDLLDIKNEKELYDLASSIVCMKLENEIEVNDRFIISNDQKVGEE